MGWRCVSGACEIAGGVWNNQGIAYYSLSEDILQLHGVMFDFLTSMSPAVFITIAILFIFTFMFAVWRTVRRQIINAAG